MNPTFVFYCYLALLAAAFTISIRNSKKTNTSYLAVFPYFLFITIVVEISGYVFDHKKLNLYNHLLLNNFQCLEFCFYLWVISKIISNHKLKKAILIINVLFTISYIINNWWGQGSGLGFSSVSYAIGAILIIFGGLIYFYELFNKINDTPLFRQPSFWVCAALIFYYLITFFVFGLINFVKAYPGFIKNNIAIFIDVSNIFLYLLLSVAFVCQSITRKLLPS